MWATEEIFIKDISDQYFKEALKKERASCNLQKTVIEYI